MPLFKGRSSLLEVQNQALIKTARERAARIDELDRELQSAAAQIGQLQRELQALERTRKSNVTCKPLKSESVQLNGTCRSLKSEPVKSNVVSSGQQMRWSGSRWSAISIPRRHQR